MDQVERPQVDPGEGGGEGGAKPPDDDSQYSYSYFQEKEKIVFIIITASFLACWPRLSPPRAPSTCLRSIHWRKK
jgi:hypothetical protein